MSSVDTWIKWHCLTDSTTHKVESSLIVIVCKIASHFHPKSTPVPFLMTSLACQFVMVYEPGLIFFWFWDSIIGVFIINMKPYTLGLSYMFTIACPMSPLQLAVQIHAIVILCSYLNLFDVNFAACRRHMDYPIVCSYLNLYHVFRCRLPDSFTQLRNLTHLALNDVSLARLPPDIGRSVFESSKSRVFFKQLVVIDYLSHNPLGRNYQKLTCKICLTFQKSIKLGKYMCMIDRITLALEHTF